MQRRLDSAGPAKPQSIAARIGEPAALAVLLALLGIGLLVGAFGFEYLGGIKPCHLCLGQRLPWPILAIAAGAAMLGLRRDANSLLAPAAFAVCAVIALWSAYLAGFHAGVEWTWWPGPPDCTGAAATGTTITFNPGEIVRCDEIAWSLFGLSLAGYNFIFSLVALAAASLGAIKTMGRAA